MLKEKSFETLIPGHFLNLGTTRFVRKKRGNTKVCQIFDLAEYVRSKVVEQISLLKRIH